MRFAFTSILA
ncbi:hypothetical protein D018_4989A, partial [Vibrio parahaemolyticus VP2007-007]